MQGDKLDAIVEGSIQKLRPVLITASIVVLGLFPAAMSNEIGAQSQKPFAITIIGGIAFGTVFRIFLIPLLFKIMKYDKIKKGAN